MATKKKTKLSDAAKNFIYGEIKRVRTVVTKHVPDCKEKKEIFAKIDELEALVKKAIG